MKKGDRVAQLVLERICMARKWRVWMKRAGVVVVLGQRG